jgi:phosphotransferase system enzyme I (PtsI)
MIRGVGVSDGIVIGKIIKKKSHQNDVKKKSIDNAEQEMNRLDEAVIKYQEYLEKIYKKTVNIMSEEEADAYQNHLTILKDSVLIGSVKKQIRDNLVNAEWLLEEVKNKYESIYNRVADDFLKKKAEYIKKITQDLIYQLSNEGHQFFGELHEPKIIMAQELVASDLIELEQGHVLGIILEDSSMHSFGTALAHSWKVPCIIGVKHIIEIVNDDEDVIMDGKKGEIIIHPDHETLELYQMKAKKSFEFKDVYEKYINVKTRTKDGYNLNLNAVTSSISDVEKAIHHGADHIGLFRTEAIFVGRDQIPDEESQFLYYKDAVEAAKGKKICFRTFDCHGTSDLPYIYFPDEKNPSLGYFSTRIALTHREILLTQIKAILRAGVFGDVRFVIPMIASIDELLDIRLLVEDAMLELDVNHVEYKENMSFGVVLETPSVALITHVFAQELNFVYVDLDDLLQYTTGVDPSNEMTFDLYDEFHPGFIRLLKSMVRGAHREGTPIEFVGDICTNELLIPFFIAMGVDGLTAESTYISRMRWEINSMNKREWGKIMREIYFMGSGNDIKMTLEKKFGELFLWKKR